MLAFIFPGQGSQRVGMGRALLDAHPECRATFDEADAALGESLTSLCLDGPEDRLTLTENAQPAILTASVAMYRALAARGVTPDVVAGHSLGEYSAHVAAGTLSFTDALGLVRRRGRYMQEAVPVGDGAMAAVLGLDPMRARELAAAAAGDEVCAVANYNSPVQTVLAGHTSAIDRAVALAREFGARRAVKLAVSAPFHSPLMAPAREGLTPMLEGTEFRDPSTPVVNNVEARVSRDGAEARDALRLQIDSPVRWAESVERMRREWGVERFVEVGPGTVLVGLIRRIAPGVEAFSLSEPGALEQFAESGG